MHQANTFSWMSLFIPRHDDMPKRRYDLDWLRVIVFGFLILFHTGMYYVANWGWHAKSVYQSQFLENIMLIVEPWRMPVLWLIAGIAIRFILAKVSVWRFVALRSLRLLLPLLFGVLVVVPPQLYVEMSYNGDLNMNYWQFLGEFFSSDSKVFDNYTSGIWPHIDVNHLWFIRSLWTYSLGLLLLTPLLNHKLIIRAVNWLFKCHGVFAIVLATLPIFVIQISHESGQARYPLGFTLMVYGYLIGWNSLFWQKLAENTKPIVIAAVTCFVGLICFYNLVWIEVIKGQEVSNQLIQLAGMFNYSLMRTLGVLTVFALAYKCLNFNSSKLHYFNDAVYPFYILHQSFILVIGFNLSKLDLGPTVEPVLLLIFTIMSCFLAYEVIHRTDILRPLFGLKMSVGYSKRVQRIGYVAASILIAPLGVEILM